MIVVGSLFADQLSKVVVRLWLSEGETVRVLGDLLHFTHVENRNAVMGATLMPMWALSLVSLAVVLGLGWWMWRRLQVTVTAERKHIDWISRLMPWVMGGALGNLIDRAFRGSVTDMISVDIPDVMLPDLSFGPLAWGGYLLERWWVFNLADSYIFISMLLLIGLSLSGRLDLE